MPKTIAITNQKGGVAKTTTAIHLAACLAEKGFQAVLVDLDPQANSSLGLGIKPSNFEIGTADIFEDPKLSPEKALTKTNVKNLWVIASDQSLARVEWEMWHKYNPAYSMILKNVLKNLDENFYVILDTPPSLGIFTINALIAADRIIVPVAPDPYALIGLKYLSTTIDDIRFTSNKSLKILGFLRTMWDERANISKEIGEQLEKMYPAKIFETAIKINVRLKEAAVAGIPVNIYDPSASSAIAYKNFSKEVLEKW